VRLLLADTSAWHHADNAAVADDWDRHLIEGSIATCAQVRLEILFSARSLPDYEDLAAELQALHQLPCGSGEFERALDVQHALAKHGGLHHRSAKIPDLLIAASAEAGDAVLWHYDEDFDRIVEITGQRAEWIAPQGSL
jgi:predicted nucleic acid-binding protein